MKSVKIPEKFLSEIVKQAEEEYPRECCGMLIGGVHARSFLERRPFANKQDERRVQNADLSLRTSATGYWMDPEELLTLQKEIRESFKTIKVIYHSHVDGPAVFSPEDLRMACKNGKPLWPGVSYLIVSVLHGKVRDTRFYAWNSEHGEFIS